MFNLCALCEFCLNYCRLSFGAIDIIIVFTYLLTYLLAHLLTCLAAQLAGELLSHHIHDWNTE